MASKIASILLKRHEKVLANIDLPGVPAGTPGKVLVASGITWHRYRVLFENGVELGMLDGRHIVRPKDFVPLDQRVDEEETAEEAAADDAGAEAAGGGDENEFGVPAHLLERARKARARHEGAA